MSQLIILKCYILLKYAHFLTTLCLLILKNVTISVVYLEENPILGASHGNTLPDVLYLRQRLSETCKATTDFAKFSGFGWHRRGDPLKSKKTILSKVAIFGMGKCFVFRLSPIF